MEQFFILVKRKEKKISITNPRKKVPFLIDQKIKLTTVKLTFSYS